MTTPRIRVDTTVNTNVKYSKVFALAFLKSAGVTDAFTEAEIRAFVLPKLSDASLMGSAIVQLDSTTSGEKYHSGRGDETFTGLLTQVFANGVTSGTTTVDATAVSTTGIHVYFMTMDGINETAVNSAVYIDKFDRSVYTSTNKNIVQYIYDNEAVLDRDPTTQSFFKIARITLPNGDNLYGPSVRWNGSVDGVFNVGNYFDSTLTKYYARTTRGDTNSSIPANTTGILYEFYYQPSKPVKVNTCKLYIHNDGSTAPQGHVQFIGALIGRTLHSVTNPSIALPYATSNTDYTQTGIIITFDDMVISTDIVFKIICSGSRNVMYVSDIQLDYV